jgi:hypothetical protein
MQCRSCVAGSHQQPIRDGMPGKYEAAARHDASDNTEYSQDGAAGLCAYGTTTNPGRQKDMSGWLITYLWVQQSCASSAGAQDQRGSVYVFQMYAASAVCACCLQRLQ